MSDIHQPLPSSVSEHKAWAGLVRSLIVLFVGVVVYFTLIPYFPPLNARYSFGLFTFTAEQVQTFALVVIGIWAVVTVGWAIVLYGHRTGFYERYYDR